MYPRHRTSGDKCNPLSGKDGVYTPAQGLRLIGYGGNVEYEEKWEKKAREKQKQDLQNAKLFNLLT